MRRGLEEKVAIITGSTSGIGLGLAQALAAEGAPIMLNGFGRKKSKPCAKVSQPGTEFASATVPRTCHNPPRSPPMVEQATAELGRVDVLINNAGI